MTERVSAHVSVFLGAGDASVRKHASIPCVQIATLSAAGVDVHADSWEQLRSFARRLLTVIDGDEAADMARGDLFELEESPSLASPTPAGEGSPETPVASAEQGEPLGAVAF